MEDQIAHTRKQKARGGGKGRWLVVGLGGIGSQFTLLEGLMFGGGEGDADEVEGAVGGFFQTGLGGSLGVHDAEKVVLGKDLPGSGGEKFSISTTPANTGIDPSTKNNMTASGQRGDGDEGWMIGGRVLVMLNKGFIGYMQRFCFWAGWGRMGSGSGGGESKSDCNGCIFREQRHIPAENGRMEAHE